MKLDQFRKFLTTSLILTILAAAFILAANVSAAPDEDLPHTVYLPLALMPPGKSDWKLSNGSLLVSDGGAAIGAVDGTLDAPIAVTIETVPAPATPMMAKATQVGSYFQVSAERDLFPPADKPLVFGLPVPDGVSTGNLAAAVVVSAEEFLDSEGSEDRWIPLQGLYEVETGLLVVTLPVLFKEGDIFTLIEHPDLGPLPDPTTAMQTNNVPTVQFWVECIQFSNPNDCTGAFKQSVVLALGTEHEDFIKHSITGTSSNPVALNRFTAKTESLSLFDGLYTGILLMQKGSEECDDFNGAYVPSYQKIFICVSPKAEDVDPELQRVIRHELFHAHQFAYREVFEEQSTYDRWVIEGTAAAVMTTDRDSWTRTTDYEPDLHHVDVPLDSEDYYDEYLAQDFWIYLGLKEGKYYEMLDTYFLAGAMTEDIANTMGKSEFRDAYFGWAANQAMEKTYDTPDNDLGDTCDFLETVVYDKKIWEEVEYYGIYNSEALPLQTIVIELVYTESFWDVPMWVTDSVYPWEEIPELRYKIYEKSEDCTAVPEGRRVLPEVDPSMTFYIMVSNVDYESSDPLGFKVWQGE